MHHEHLLQQAVVDSLDTLEQRLAALENAVAPPGTSGNGDSTHASVDAAERGSGRGHRRGAGPAPHPVVG